MTYTYTSEDFLKLLRVWDPTGMMTGYFSEICMKMSPKKALKKTFGFGLNHKWWKYIFRTPWEDMSLLLFHECKWISEVAEWRLTIGK